MAICEHKSKCENYTSECNRLAHPFMNAKKGCLELPSKKPLTLGSIEAHCSIDWALFTDKRPEIGEWILAYTKGRTPQTSFHTIKYYKGDETQYTHWASLEAPNQ